MKCLYLGKNKITKIQNLDSLHTLEVLSLQVGGTTVSYTAYTRSAQFLGGWYYCELYWRSFCIIVGFVYNHGGLDQHDQFQGELYIDCGHQIDQCVQFCAGSVKL